MEHFLFYAMGLSFVSFLSIILTKPPVDLPPYQIPQASPELGEPTGGQARGADQHPVVLAMAAPPPNFQDIIETAVCHPSISPSNAMANWQKARTNRQITASES